MILYYFRDMTVKGDGVFAIDVFVEGVLIAKGEGDSPVTAEGDAMEDFVER